MKVERTRGSIDAIAAIVRSRIVSHEYGDTLPTEATLMEEFGASRYTIRTALQQLVVDGLVERHSGKGTFVSSRIPSDGRWYVRSIEDLIGEHLKRHPEILSVGTITAGDYPAAAKAFSAASDAPLLMIERLYRLDERPQVYMRGIMPASLAHHIVVADISSGSLVRTVERVSSRKVAKMKQTTGATVATGRVRELLELGEGSAILTMRREFVDVAGQLLILSENFSVGEQSPYVIEMERQ